MNKIIKKILEYLCFWLLGYIITIFIKIPINIIIVTLVILGGISIIIKFDSKDTNIIQKIPIIKDYLQYMKKVNQKIGQSVQGGTLKDSIKFSFGIFYLLTYYFAINLFIISIKLVYNALINNPTDLIEIHFMEGFSLMFGAGIIAYLVWLRHIAKEIKTIKMNRKEMNAIVHVYSISKKNVKFNVLLSSFLIWLLGELVFLIFSPSFHWIIPWFVIFGVVYFVIIALALIFSRFLNLQPQETK